MVLVLTALGLLVAEVVAFVAVGEQIGFGWATLLLLGVSALGPFVVRRAGLTVLSRAQDRLARGEPPTRELLDGVLVLVGGALVCVPGFITDAVGLFVLVPPVRHLLIRSGGHYLARRVQALRFTRRHVINVRARSRADDRSPPQAPTRDELEPGERGEP